MKTFDLARTARRRFLRDGALVTLAFTGLRNALEYSTGVTAK